MASVVSESFIVRASYPSNEKERPINKLQRQFYELEKQCDKYFDDLGDVEDMKYEKIPVGSQSGEGDREKRCTNTCQAVLSSDKHGRKDEESRRRRFETTKGENA